jgi:hypothetical protein
MPVDISNDVRIPRGLEHRNSLPSKRVENENSPASAPSINEPLPSTKLRRKVAANQRLQHLMPSICEIATILAHSLVIVSERVVGPAVVKVRTEVMFVDKRTVVY